MVIVNRNGIDFEPLPLCQNTGSGERRSGGSFGFGSLSLMPSPRYSSSSFYPTSSRFGKEQSNNWLIKAVYAAATVSWIASRLFIGDLSSTVAPLENNVVAIKAQMMHLMDDLDIVERYMNEERQHLNKLKKTRNALEHEIRLVSAVETASGTRIRPAPRADDEQLIKGWLSHRHDSLLYKIVHLQRYLQSSSRKAVLEKQVESGSSFCSSFNSIAHAA